MPHPLEQKLTQLARRWRSLLLFHGLAWLATVVLAAVIVLGLADYLIRFQDRGVRTICSLAALVAAGWAVYRFLWPALSARPTNVQLAQRIERRFPSLADRLASTMYFLEQPEDSPEIGSATLRRAVVHQTTIDAADLDLDEALDPRPTHRALMIAGGAAVLALGLMLVSPGSAQIALARLILPWGSVSWPQRNHLAFREPIDRLASGQDFEVEIIDLDGAPLPDDIAVEYRRTNLDGEATGERLPATRLGESVFARQESVMRPFEYRAVGGDDHSMPWTAVEVLEPPAIEKLSIRLRYPPYTGWPPQPGDKQLRALIGTRVGFEASVSKPLRLARLRRDGAEPLLLKLNADGHGFSLSSEANPGFVIEQTGSYWFELEDTDGLSGGADLKYEVRAIPDSPPTVAIEVPTTDLHVAPQAMIPLKVSAKDDLAIASITRLVDRSDQSDKQTERTVLFQGPPQAAPPPAASRSAADAGDQRVIEETWDLQPLGLTPGTQLTLRVAAADYRPAEALSPPRRITIITLEELDDRLAERQAQLAAELARTLKLEQAARGQVSALEIQLREVGKLAPADVDRLQNAEIAHRQVSRSLTSKTDGLRSQVAGVLNELADNRLEQPDVAARMENLAGELDRLGRESLPSIERDLTAARKQAAQESPGDSGGKTSDDKSAEPSTDQSVSQAIRQAGKQQDEVISALERQLADLRQWDSYRQFHRDLGQVARDQESVNEATAKFGRETLAKPLNSLSAQERADLQKLADEQQALGRRFEKVEQEMQQAAERLGGEDPAGAETLKDAVREGRQANVSRELGEAGKNLGGNQIGQAVGRQKQALEQMREMLDILANRQESSLSRLVEKLRAAEEEIADLRKQQAGLRKKLEDAARETDPAEKKRQLERLAKEEKDLAEKAQALARRLERLQAQSAGDRTGKAAKSLGKAGQSGSQGDGQQAAAEAAQAEKDLEQAEAEIAQSRRQAEMDLAFEQLAKIKDALVALKSRQQEVVNEAARLLGIRQAQGKLSGGQSESVGQLGREQRQVSVEAAAAGTKLGPAEVFSRTLEHAVKEMTQAAERLERQELDATADRYAQQSLRRLEWLLAALEPDAGGEKKAGGDQGGDGGGGSGGSANANQDGIAEIAQLKLIKLLQVDLNARTRELDLSRGRQPTLTAEQQQAYEALSAEQGELADLIRNLTPVESGEIENDPEKLPDVRNPDGGGANDPEGDATNEKDAAGRPLLPLEFNGRERPKEDAR